MSGIRIYQIDAFADRVFSGNPAAVCPLTEWLPDELMQAIAAENNLSETAFFVPDGEGDYDLRWFTPTIEVELCGHATLASAFVILECMATGREAVSFNTRSGRMAVARRDDLLYLDFPAHQAVETEIPEALAGGLGVAPRAVLEGPNYMAVFAQEAEVAALEPEFRSLAKLYPRGVIATAPGEDCDFVSRYFAPAHGVDEDPVTGSAHCMLIPYWSVKLARKSLLARQISARGGTLHCEDRGPRVGIGGRASLYMEGTVRI